MATKPKLAAIDAAIAEHGFKIVLLLRLSPVFPFNLLNYALGLTRVQVRDYVLASFIGMLPGTALYVYLGSLVTRASELIHTPMRAGGGLVAARRAASFHFEQAACGGRDFFNMHSSGAQPSAMQACSWV